MACAADCRYTPWIADLVCNAYIHGWYVACDPAPGHMADLVDKFCIHVSVGVVPHHRYSHVGSHIWILTAAMHALLLCCPRCWPQAAQPHDQPLWQMAQVMGAECSTQYNPAITTHLITYPERGATPTLPLTSKVSLGSQAWFVHGMCSGGGGVCDGWALASCPAGCRTIARLLS